MNVFSKIISDEFIRKEKCDFHNTDKNLCFNCLGSKLMVLSDKPATINTARKVCSSFEGKLAQINVKSKEMKKILSQKLISTGTVCQ